MPMVDSTNSEAQRLAPSATGPVWILAEEQTAGRGRRGREWSSPRGNFSGTLLMQPQEGADVVALRSFVAALALREVFVAVTGLSDAFRLKWPNDVLLNGGKVAGILLESVGVGPGVSYLAVGIGVNLIWAPDVSAVEVGAVPPVSLLAETGARVTPEAFLDALAPAFARWEAVLVAEGFGPLREAWLAHAARLGEVIRARTSTLERHGVFETIDATGALMLRQAQGIIAIPAADVFF